MAGAQVGEACVALDEEFTTPKATVAIPPEAGLARSGGRLLVERAADAIDPNDAQHFSRLRVLATDDLSVVEAVFPEVARDLGGRSWGGKRGHGQQAEDQKLR